MQVNLLASIEEGEEEEERSLSGSLLFLVSHPYETTYAMKMQNVFIIMCSQITLALKMLRKHASWNFLHEKAL